MYSIMKRYIVYGNVQGVGFRKWTRKNALEMNLNGFCRNRTDGTVEIVVGSNDDEAVNAFEMLLQEGPERAEVDRVEEKNRKRDVKPGFKIYKTKT